MKPHPLKSAGNVSLTKLPAALGPPRSVLNSQSGPHLSHLPAHPLGRPAQLPVGRGASALPVHPQTQTGGRPPRLPWAGLPVPAVQDPRPLPSVPNAKGKGRERPTHHPTPSPPSFGILQQVSQQRASSSLAHSAHSSGVSTAVRAPPHNDLSRQPNKPQTSLSDAQVARMASEGYRRAAVKYLLSYEDPEKREEARKQMDHNAQHLSKETRARLFAEAKAIVSKMQREGHRAASLSSSGRQSGQSPPKSNPTPPTTGLSRMLRNMGI